MNWLQVIILSIVEGITEFLPISSTGHMIITSSIMGISSDEFTKLFEICVQPGAILAVVVLYWKKFFDFSRLQFYYKLIVAVIPALILGYLLSDKIDELLESPVTVAMSFIAGGVALLFIDNLFNKAEIESEEKLSYLKSFSIGLWQVIAMIPGVSRSAATIVGGMQQKLSRKFAAEFSFFLAVPTLCAAAGYKILKAIKEQPEMLKDKQNLLALGVGNLIAFIVAMIAIRTFIQYLQKHSFRAFGFYRIFAGLIILALIYANIIKKENAAPAAEQAKTSMVKSIVVKDRT
ncbi:MAG: UDP-diphosphatase [Bacteroidetes bacterium 46-16]|nr:MAG: UDP-diphosphatase [Bacteroidetes bacterium 46-16]